MTPIATIDEVAKDGQTKVTTDTINGIGDKLTSGTVKSRADKYKPQTRYTNKPLEVSSKITQEELIEKIKDSLKPKGEKIEQIGNTKKMIQEEYVDSTGKTSPFTYALDLLDNSKADEVQNLTLTITYADGSADKVPVKVKLDANYSDLTIYGTSKVSENSLTSTDTKITGTGKPGATVTERLLR